MYIIFGPWPYDREKLQFPIRSSNQPVLELRMWQIKSFKQQLVLLLLFVNNTAYESNSNLSLLLFINGTTYVSNNNLCHCWLSTAQLMRQTTRVTVVFCQRYNLCVKQLVFLLLFVNNTTYVSNKSCHCCCLSTAQQFVSNNTSYNVISFLQHF